MTDCSSIQGSTSSSSDVMTLTTAASSWCAIPTNSRIRVLRLIRPHHTRRMLMVTGPESSPSYGFAVRGGKEFSTGFFVSQVERNSEADLKGLRIGDQILRLNGFRVEDAVHKEFIRFVGSQDRLTLKVRGVGMLPIKDKENERLSWNVVKMHSVSNTPSESSYKTITTEHSSNCSAVGVGVGDLRSKDVSIILDVAPRTKLGLGICKGPEWKPGIFVQFTKEKSVAREAGLRPGDQILSVNSIDFSDVLFSEAVAVMKSSNKLEMIVRTAAGCDLFPGESSGYNSSASSVTGDQSPCWADIKSKRLTAVHEEPTIAACWNEALYAEQRRNAKLQDSRDAENINTTPKEVNKTIIKLSENGTSINNTYIAANSHNPNRYGAPQKVCNTTQQDNTLTKTQISHVPPPPPAGLYSNVEQPGRVKAMKTSPNTVRCNGNGNINGNGNGNKTVIVDIHRNQNLGEEKQKQTTTLQRNASKAVTPAASSSTLTSTSTKSSGPPKAPPPVFYGNLGNYINKNSNSNNNNNNNNNNKSNQNTAKSNNFGDVGAAGSTLSSAITEELKKRKEKQRSTNSTNNADNNMSINNNSNNYGNKLSNARNEQPQQHQHHHHEAMTTMTTSTVTMKRNQQQQQQQSQIQHQHQHNQHCHHHPQLKQQQQQQQHQQLAPLTSPTKRAPSIRGANSNTTNCSNSGGSGSGSGSGGNLDQHSALMDEFKRAHQRMFRNGFHETESKERQEVLKRTAIMEDDTSHRTCRHFTNGMAAGDDCSDGHHHHHPPQQQSQQPPQLHQPQIPSPPPQFANSPPKSSQTTNSNIYNYQTIKRSNGAISTSNGTRQISSTNQLKPPSSPTPDYDNILRGEKQVQISNGIENANPNRRTLRLGAVTIGEYEQQRKEPSKFGFIGAQNRDKNINEMNTDLRKTDNFQNELQNTLTRSKLKNGNYLEHQHDCPLRNSYSNGNGNAVDQMTRKLHGVNLNQKSPPTNAATATMKRQIGGTGILKNGNSRNGGQTSNGNGGHTAKVVEKTISFGN